MTSNGHTNGEDTPPSSTQSSVSPSSVLLPSSSQYTPRGSLPNTPLAVSVISAVLGGVALTSLSYAAQALLRSIGSEHWRWARPQLGIYAFAWALFHLCEFWTTAGWNPLKLSVDAFLLNNTKQYHAAHLFGLAEYFISSYFYPQKFESEYFSLRYTTIIVVFLLAAQALRSLAMIHANVSFSHVVKSVKHEDHVLITNGVYSVFRHPSYAGFFYWAIATQLLLGNVVSTLAFVIILGRFFYRRIRDEEKHLIRFFGEDYIQYQKRVGTGLPFMIFAA